MNHPAYSKYYLRMAMPRGTPKSSCCIAAAAAAAAAAVAAAVVAAAPCGAG